MSESRGPVYCTNNSPEKEEFARSEAERNRLAGRTEPARNPRSRSRCTRAGPAGDPVRFWRSGVKPALSQVCSLGSGFEEDILDYAAGGCDAIEVWFTKLENHLASHTIESIRQLCQTSGVCLPVASFQGGLLSSQGESRRAAWELYERRLDLCRQLDIGTLVVACDVSRPLGPQDIERTRVSVRQLGEQAAMREVRVALEFQATAALGNNLQTAAALVAEAANPFLGLCLDSFHFHVGPSKPEDLTLLTADNLFHVQLSDLADRPRELALDGDRILPGDGDLDFAPILNRLRAIGYDRHVSIESMNPQFWQIPPRQFGEIAWTSLRKLLGLASMRNA